MSALGYEGYLCAMGQQMINGTTHNRGGDALIIFKPAIYKLKVGAAGPHRTEVVIRCENVYCKLFLEITIEELFTACRKANEKAAANRKAGD